MDGRVYAGRFIKRECGLNEHSLESTPHRTYPGGCPSQDSVDALVSPPVFSAYAEVLLMVEPDSKRVPGGISRVSMQVA